jgi:hypothetical protein
MVDPYTAMRGIVTSVRLESNAPKLVVDGVSYGLDQVLSVVPAAEQFPRSLTLPAGTSGCALE